MEGSELQPMADYREIFTKSVIGNTSKSVRVSGMINLPKGQSLTHVLGSTVSTCQITGVTGIKEAVARQEPGITISGSMQAHVWYAYNNGKATDLMKQTIEFNEVVPVKVFTSGECQPVEAQIIVVKEPNFLETSVVDNKQIKFTVELEVSAQIIGETKVWVRIYRPKNE